MKKIIVLLFILIPLGAFSQEQKIAYVDAVEVLSMMPENNDAENKFMVIRERYENELKIMQDELNVKYEEYMKIQETLTENLKLRRQQEIQDLNSRIENFVPVAQQEIEKEQAALYAPIQEKLLKTIEAVGTEQGYIILNPQALLHVGNAIDATPLVKAKLGLK